MKFKKLLSLVLWASWFIQGCPALARNQNSAERLQISLASKKEAISLLESGKIGKFGVPSNENDAFLLLDLKAEAARLEWELKTSSPKRNLRKSLEEVTSLALKVVNAYPRSSLVSRAWLTRGLANLDLNKKDEALADLMNVYEQSKVIAQKNTAALAAYDLLIEKKKFSQAKFLMDTVAKTSKGEMQHIARENGSWASYYEGDILGALQQITDLLEREQKLVHDLTEKGEKSALGVRQILKGLVHFIAAGLEKKEPGLRTVEECTAYLFQHVSPKFRSEAILQLARALGNNNSYAELAKLRNEVLKVKEEEKVETGDKATALEIDLISLNSCLDSTLNDQALAVVDRIIEDLKLVQPTEEELVRVKQGFQKSADRLGKSPAKYRDGITKIYRSLLAMPESENLKKITTRKNFGELAFAGSDFELAALQFRELAIQGNQNERHQMLLKALSSRYESLKEKKLIPVNDLGKNTKCEKKRIHPLISEWIGWVDELYKEKAHLAIPFRFEAARILAALGYQGEAFSRFEIVSMDDDKSDFAMRAAGICLDSAKARQDWEKVDQLVRSYEKREEWKSSKFRAQLMTLKMEAAYERVLAAFRSKNYRLALELEQVVGVENGAKSHRGPLLLVAGRAALALGNISLARIKLEEAQKQALDSSSLLVCELLLAGIDEDEMSLEKAQSHYLRAANDKNSSNREITNQAKSGYLRMVWLSGNLKELAGKIRSDEWCGAKLREECKAYERLIALEELKGREISLKELKALSLQDGSLLLSPGNLAQVGESKNTLSFRLPLVALLEQKANGSISKGRPKFATKMSRLVNFSDFTEKLSRLKKFEKSLAPFFDDLHQNLRTIAFTQLASSYQSALEELKLLGSSTDESVRGMKENIKRLEENLLMNASIFSEKAFESAGEGFMTLDQSATTNRLFANYHPQDSATASYGKKIAEFSSELELLKESLRKESTNSTAEWIEVFERAVDRRDIRKVGYMVDVAHLNSKFNARTKKLTHAIAISLTQQGSELVETLESMRSESPLDERDGNICVVMMKRSLEGHNKDRLFRQINQCSDVSFKKRGSELLQDAQYWVSQKQAEKVAEFK